MSRGRPAASQVRGVVLVSATLIYWTSTHTLRPLLPLHLESLGVSDASIGIILAAHSLGSLLLALPSGRLVDRLGPKVAVGLGFSLMALSGVGYIVAGGGLQFALLLTAAGVIELVVWISLQALSPTADDGPHAARTLSAFSFAWGLGLAAGPILGATLLASFGFSALGVVYASGSLIGAAIILLAGNAARRGRAGQDEEPQQPAGPLRGRLVAIVAVPGVQATLLASFVGLFTHAIKLSYYPIVLSRLGFSVATVGFLLSAMSIASLIARIPVPWLTVRLGRRRLLLWSMLLPIVGLAAVPFVSSLVGHLLLAAVAGAGFGINPPVTVELMARSAPLQDRGLAMSTRLVANRAAGLLQPLVFAGLVTFGGLTTAFVGAAALMGATTLLASRAIGDLDGASSG